MLVVVSDLPLHFLLVVEDELQLVVLIVGFPLLEDLEQFVLLADEIFDFLGGEVLVDLLFGEMAPQFLRVLLELLVVFLDLGVEGDIGMVHSVLANLLGEEWHNIDIGSLLDFDHKVGYFMPLVGSDHQQSRFNWGKQLTDAVVDRSEGKLLSFECLC